MMEAPGGPVAQLNIGQLWHPPNDPRIAGFTDNTAKVNVIAERSKGFVWRCPKDQAAREEIGVTLYGGDPCRLWTMSVWETAEDLAHFVLKTVHGAFVGRRSDWFRPQDHRTYVIWPIPVGHRPSLKEGLDRLAVLEAAGPTDAAFDFGFLRAATPVTSAGVSDGVV